MILALMLGLSLLTSPRATQPPAAQQAQSFEKKIVKTVSSHYLLALPKEYNQDKKKKWPLILFLHGAGERGDDLNKVKVHGPPKLIEAGKDLGAIVISPQCPENDWWSNQTETLNALLDTVIAKYRVDESRVYCTGLSMGGYGTWALAIAYPTRFAAIAPVCGGGDARRVRLIKDIPTWVFHGAKDSVVNIKEDEAMVEALKAAGGNVKFTVYPEADHDSWTETYNNPEFFEWLLKQERPAKK